MGLITFSAGQVEKSADVNANFALCVLTDTSKTITVTHTWTAAQTFTGGATFGTSLSSTTALATPSAYTSTTATFFASTVSGAALMGFGTTNDVALMNRTGTVVLGVGPNTTTVNLVGLLDLSGASAGQIAFPATQNASAGANTLDDYEEGTWTPNDQSGASLAFTSVTGTYVKIGQFVLVNGAFTYPATGDGSNAVIGGLPFTTNNVAANRGGWIVYTSETTLARFHPNANDTKGGLSNTGGSSLTNATLSGDNVILAACYRATA